MQRKQNLVDQSREEFNALLKIRMDLFLSEKIAPSEKQRKFIEIGKRLDHMITRSGHLAEQHRVAKRESLDPDEIRFFGFRNLQSRL